MSVAEMADEAEAGSEMPPQMRIEVACATPGKQRIVRLRVPQGTTVAEAIEMSGIAQVFPEAATRAGVGIFGRKVAEDHLLQEGDRVEIYRPLRIDPKEARRRKADRGSR